MQVVLPKPAALLKLAMLPPDLLLPEPELATSADEDEQLMINARFA